MQQHLVVVFANGNCILNDLSNSPLSFRTIWISDTHLGTPGARVDELLHFLKHTQSETLYLVGDIIDGWQLKKRFFWPQKHNDVIQKILRKARNGTKVIYIPGNHDEAAREYIDYSFGEVEIHMDYIHHTSTGEKLWVVHGDLFDNVIKHARWLAYLGDFAYVSLLRANRLINTIRQLLKLPYWSFSQYLKHKVKSAVSFISAFETAMVTETRRRDCDGVVCGHIHKPEIREIDGIRYYNDGDWVESVTAMVEHHDGSIEIINWANMAGAEPVSNAMMPAVGSG